MPHDYKNFLQSKMLDEGIVDDNAPRPPDTHQGGISRCGLGAELDNIHPLDINAGLMCQPL
jgi:hypothetical protein